MDSSSGLFSRRAALAGLLGVVTACGSQPANRVDPTRVLAGVSTVCGKRFDVASLGGTPSVLWFWAPWCVICAAEAPDVVSVAAATEVPVVGVAGRGALGDMREFIDRTGVGSLVHLADESGAVWSHFGVFGQPAFVFLSADGSYELHVGALGAEALSSRLEQLR